MSSSATSPLPSLVVLTNGNFFARIILEDLFEKHGSSIAGVIIVTGDYQGRSGLRAGWHLLHSMALPFFLYKVITLSAFSIAQRVWPNRILTVEGLCRSHGLSYWTERRVNSQRSMELARSCTPDLFVSVSCPQRIKKSYLDLAPHGGINIHSSLLPAYAGLAPYFWVLSKGESSTGVTVHQMVRQFDQGNVLAQAPLAIDPGESAFHLFLRLARLGSRVLVEACEQLAIGGEGDPQPTEGSSYFSHPDLKACFDLKKEGHCLVRPNEIWHSIRR